MYGASGRQPIVQHLLFETGLKGKGTRLVRSMALPFGQPRNPTHGAGFARLKTIEDLSCFFDVVRSPKPTIHDCQAVGSGLCQGCNSAGAKVVEDLGSLS